MPCITVDRERLFDRIGKKFSDDEFDELCFSFGIELDAVVSDDKKISYKIEIPANRCELLCIEGLSHFLGIFLQKQKIRQYTLTDPRTKMFVNPSVIPIRPYIVCCILRNISLNQVLIQKLHQNICRKRTLVSIGTHDLDCIRSPFTYTAEPHKSIRFQALTLDQEYDANEILHIYQKNKVFKGYVEIIDKFNLCPVVKDSDGCVLSLPPVINGVKSRLTTETKNILIECTATDLIKAQVVLNAIATCFSEHCQTPFTVESVDIVFPNNIIETYPKFPSHTFKIDHKWLNKNIGVSISAENHSKNLYRMGLLSEVINDPIDDLCVQIPPNRFDIIHKFDILEDAAISYGFNSIIKSVPPIAVNGSQILLNRFCDQLRYEMVNMTYTETLSFVLSSSSDLMEKMNLDENNMDLNFLPVYIQTTYDNNCVRNSLIPCLLKTISCNRKMALPIKIFEISDIVRRDKHHHNGARNVRNLCGIYCGTSSGFEQIHGVLDRIMSCINVNAQFMSFDSPTYSLCESNNPIYFPLRSCDILINDSYIGHMGVIHPTILKKFEINGAVCSIIEINVEKLLDFYHD